MTARKERRGQEQSRFLVRRGGLGMTTCEYCSGNRKSDSGGGCELSRGGDAAVEFFEPVEDDVDLGQGGGLLLFLGFEHEETLAVG